MSVYDNHDIILLYIYKIFKVFHVHVSDIQIPRNLSLSTSMVLPVQVCVHQMAELSGSVPLVNCPAERASTWDMLIRLSFRAEGTSNFFPIKEEPADTPTCTKVEAETQLGFSGVRSRRQPVPRPCLPDSSPEIDPRSSGPKEPPAEPQRRGESRAASPFSELQVRLQRSSALRNARTDCCKTLGKFLSHTYYAKQTFALFNFTLKMIVFCNKKYRVQD